MIQLHDDQVAGPRIIQQISDEFFATHGLDMFLVGMLATIVLVILLGYYGDDRHFHYLNIACLPLFATMVAYGYQYDDVIFLGVGAFGLFQTSVKVYKYWASKYPLTEWSDEA